MDDKSYLNFTNEITDVENKIKWNVKNSSTNRVIIL